MSKQALISVSDKSNLLEFARELVKQNYTLISTGGTFEHLTSNGLSVVKVEDITKFKEMLGGRVKTLHPAIHAGILATQSESDRLQLEQSGFKYIDLVVCNLYPFIQKVQNDTPLKEAVEVVDIGGVTLLRAAAKNCDRVSVIVDANDYSTFLDYLKKSPEIPNEFNVQLATKAFAHTAIYDASIARYFQNQQKSAFNLRYGMNPHQTIASVAANLKAADKLPFRVLSGSPGFINLLDALNGYALVRELDIALGLPAATSFKHVSPAGAAIGLPLTVNEAIVFQVNDFKPELETGLSPLACAFARARGGDRMSSFGDFISLSRTCDLDTARLISREVSDGIIAPGYTQQALEVLQKKKAGKYCILEMDKNYVPDDTEYRTIYGVSLSQSRNSLQITPNMLPPTLIHAPSGSSATNAILRDATVALISLKYTQSNSVVVAVRGAVVGVGAGQQSRIHCVRLACSKAESFLCRFHPSCISMLTSSPESPLSFQKEVKRAEKSNVMDVYSSGEIESMTQSELNSLSSLFTNSTLPPVLGAQTRSSFVQKREFVAKMCEGLSEVEKETEGYLVCGSDAFFPFQDNVHRLARSGVKVIVAPGGSVQDEGVLQTAKDYEMTVFRTPWRLFHH